MYLKYLFIYLVSPISTFNSAEYIWHLNKVVVVVVVIIIIIIIIIIIHVL